MNVLAIGASKNIGYYAALRLLGANSNVTFMLRSPAVFDSDATIQSYVQSGKAHLLKGDALVKDDVKRAWNEASTRGPVDLLLFTVGGAPSFSLRKGFVITPHNLVTQALLNVLCTIPKQFPPPKIVAVTLAGVTHRGHVDLPIPIKALYSLIDVPHKDKLGAERAVAYCTGWKWDDGEQKDEIMGERWRDREGLPAPGTLKEVLVVRPALLTDGDCQADKKENAYRVREGDTELRGVYTISRKDVAHFIVDAVLHRWDEFSNKAVNIGY